MKKVDMSFSSSLFAKKIFEQLPLLHINDKGIVANGICLINYERVFPISTITKIFKNVEEKQNYLIVEDQKSIIVFKNRSESEGLALILWYDKKLNGIVLWNSYHPGNVKDYVVLNSVIKRIKRMSKIKFTFGCDPEFETIDINGKVVSASYAIGKEDTNSPIGTDGNSGILEFRPRAGSPSVVWRDLLRLIYKEFPARYPVYGISCKGKRYPLGFHIHIGGAYPTSGFISLLDKYIGMPLRKLEPPLRRGSEYSGLSLFRIKNAKLCWDTFEIVEGYGFEYRTPPSVSPRLMLQALKLTKMITEYYWFENSDLVSEIEKEHEKLIKMTKKSRKIILRPSLSLDYVYLPLKDDWETGLKIFVHKNFSCVEKFFGLKRERGEIMYVHSSLPKKVKLLVRIVASRMGITKIVTENDVDVDIVGVGIPHEWRLGKKKEQFLNLLSNFKVGNKNIFKIFRVGG